MLIGTQIAGIEKELTKDFSGTFKRLRKLGFNAIEPVALFSKEQGSVPKNQWAMDTMAQAKIMLDELGFAIPSVYIWMGDDSHIPPVDIAVQEMLKINECIGAKYFVISSLIGTSEDAKRFGDLAFHIASGLKPHGCTLVYHNHDSEFTPIIVDGEQMTVLDCFFRFAGPDVRLQLDIGWAAVGGDEAAFAQRYAERIVSLHLKDFYSGFRKGKFTCMNMPLELFAPIGMGGVKTAEILALRKKFPHFNGSILIDQDKYDGDMFDALKIGYHNIDMMLEREAE